VHGFFHTVTELAVTVMFKLITCIWPVYSLMIHGLIWVL
jgi:hypothetical protein